jgi:hypothetical protein
MRVRPRWAVASRPRPLARRLSVMAAWPPQDGQPQDSYYDYDYGYWQQQQPPPAGHYNPAFFGPFHPSWPAFYPPPPPLGLGDHRGAAPQQQQQQQHAPEWHNNHRRGGRYSSRRNQHPPPQGPSPPPRQRDRSPPRPRAAEEEEEQSAAAAYGPDGSYIPPSRRQRRDTRHAIVAPPTPTYLAAAADDASSTRDDADSEPIALVMDLNHTLLCRAKRNRQASKMPIVRPYLAPFLTYICTPRSPSTLTPKFAPIVYSSARAPNVLSMLAALDLIPPARRLAHLNKFDKHPYEPSPEQGDVLRMVFTREMMGLSERDYAGDVETVKDLGKVWERLGWAGSDDEDGVELAAADEHEDLNGGQGPPQKKAKLNRKAKARLATRRDTIGARRTLLLDDEAGKAVSSTVSLSLPEGRTVD